MSIISRLFVMDCEKCFFIVVKDANLQHLHEQIPKIINNLYVEPKHESK